MMYTGIFSSASFILILAVISLFSLISISLSITTKKIPIAVFSKIAFCSTAKQKELLYFETAFFNLFGYNLFCYFNLFFHTYSHQINGLISL